MNYINYNYDPNISLDLSLNGTPFTPNRTSTEQVEKQLQEQQFFYNGPDRKLSNAGLVVNPPPHGANYNIQSQISNHRNNNTYVLPSNTVTSASTISANNNNSFMEPVSHVTANSSFNNTGFESFNLVLQSKQPDFQATGSNIFSGPSNSQQLQLKETQIEMLEREVQALKSMLNNKLVSKNNNNDKVSANGTVTLPASIQKIFQKLCDTLQEKKKELEQVQKDLETVLTALALNPSNSVTKYGRYDVEALSHKMVVRMEMLTRENTEMSKMLAYGRSKDTEIALQLARKENQELKEQLKKLRQDQTQSV